MYKRVPLPPPFGPPPFCVSFHHAALATCCASNGAALPPPICLRLPLRRPISKMPHLTLLPSFAASGSPVALDTLDPPDEFLDRKSTRLNSSHLVISYAV